MNTDTDFNLHNAVSNLVGYLTIAHHIPGRIRFKIDAAILKDPLLSNAKGDTIPATLGAIRGVHYIKLNKIGRSCTIEYDNQIIPDQAWVDLISGENSTAAATLFDIIKEKYMEFSRG